MTGKLGCKCIPLESGEKEASKLQRRKQNYSTREKERNLIVPEREEEERSEENKEMGGREGRGCIGEVERSHTLQFVSHSSPIRGLNSPNNLCEGFLYVGLFDFPIHITNGLNFYLGYIVLFQATYADVGTGGQRGLRYYLVVYICLIL